MPSQQDGALLTKLQAYWAHQLQLLKGYEKNADKLAENTRIITGWMDDIAWFLANE